MEAIIRDRERNSLKETLQTSLFHSFLMNRYDAEESTKLTLIAILPVSSALELAHEAWKMHLEAINTGLLKRA